MTTNAPLCTCPMWTGRAALHYRREGCTEPVIARPEAGSTDALIVEAADRYVTAFQPVADALGDTAHRLAAAHEAALRNGHGRP